MNTSIILSMVKKDTTQKRKPLWDVTSHYPDLPTITQDITTEICIVGAGITGLSLGYLLCKEGKKVVIVDKSEIGFGETGVTTAHLTYMLDDRWKVLEKLHGTEKIKMLLESHKEAIDTIEATVKKEKIDCDFERVDGYLFLGSGDKEEVLDQELEVAHRLGFKKMKKMQEIDPAQKNLGPAVKFPDQAQFHPLKYLNGLVKAILKNGGEIYTHAMVQNLEEASDGVRVSLESGNLIKAKKVVMATNTPFEDKKSKMYTKQSAYRTYAIGIEVPEKTVKKALYWDTETPYHYIRWYSYPDAKSKVHHELIVGGEDHKTGQQDNNVNPYDKLLTWTRQKFPEAKRDTAHEWSGQVMEPNDRLGFIGINPGSKRVYVATGFSGSGMTYGVVAAKIIADLLLRKKNRLAPIYDPARTSLKNIGKFIQENTNVAIRYVNGRMPSKNRNSKNIPNGTGVVVSRGSEKVAIFKDTHGKVCEYSAICTHLGCIVTWNSLETTWDCPCHGSRFSAHGKVLNGPARFHLKKMKKGKSAEG